MSQSVREGILKAALAATCGDRNKTYGEPIDQFTRHAELCTAYFGFRITPHDVAIFHILGKISRVPGNYTHDDNYLDAAAYCAIAGEMASYGAFTDREGGSQGTTFVEPEDGRSSAEIQKANSAIRDSSNNPFSPSTRTGRFASSKR